MSDEMSIDEICAFHRGASIERAERDIATLREVHDRRQKSADLERRAETYRAALENIAELARARCDLEAILMIASDALAEDAQEG